VLGTAATGRSRGGSLAAGFGARPRTGGHDHGLRAFTSLSRGWTPLGRRPSPAARKPARRGGRPPRDPAPM